MAGAATAAIFVLRAPTAEDSTAIASAYLAAGDRDAAIAHLTRTVRDDPADGAAAARLAEALLDRGRARDVPFALSHAERAARAGRSTARVRAVRDRALDAMGLGAADAPADVRAPTSVERREDALYAETLGAWADRVLAHDAAGARTHLDAARREADALTALTGDPTSRAVVDAAREDLAEAHRDFRDGRKQYEHLDTARAARAFAAARAALEGAGSPLAADAAFFEATCASYAGDYPASVRAFRALRARPDIARRAGLAGRVDWMLGLTTALAGRPDEAVAPFRSAIDAFDAAGRASDATSLRSILAATLHVMGDEDGEWTARLRALHALEQVDEPRRRGTVLLDTGLSCLEDGVPWAALRVLELGLAVIEPTQEPVDVANAHLVLARARRAVGEGQGAAEALATSRTWIARVVDEGIRRRLGAELALAEATGSPQSLRGLTEAIAWVREAGAGSRVPAMLAARARAHASAADEPAAARDFDAALDAILGIRESLSSAAERIAYADAAHDVVVSGVDFFARRANGATRALAFAERYRTHESREPGAMVSTADTRIVVYAALPERLLIWVIGPDGPRMSAAPVGAERLDHIVRDFRDAIGAAGPPDRILESSSALYDTAIRPVRGWLAPAARWVFVLDGPLHAVPFAALFDRESGRFVIEDVSIGVAPSVASVGRERGPTGLPEPLRAVAIGDPSFDAATFPSLRRLPDAADEARRVAAGYSDSSLHVGADATERAALRALVEADVVHVAAHATADARDPQLSGLVLAGGLLTAAELAEIRDPRARLVVLAGCSTAAGAMSRSEGPLSLARPLLASGVPAVVATLWDVGDRSIAPLMVRFHAVWRAGGDAGQALRAAQLSALRAHGDASSDPRVWAAAVVVGTGGPPSRQQSPNQAN